MKNDPIVEEVRAIREALAKRHDYDVDALVQALRVASAERGHDLVSLPPKPIDDGKAA